MRDLMEQNKKMQAQVERLLREKKENDKMVARLDSMEKLMGENEKLQEQVNELQQNQSPAVTGAAVAAAATGAAAVTATGAAAVVGNPPTESPRRSPRLRRRDSHPRTKPKPPTHHRSPRPSTPTGNNLRRRLSFTNESGNKNKSGKKRKSACKSRSLVRKTIGEAMRLNMDELLQNQFFRDEHRRFKLEEFRHHVNPLLDQIDLGEDVDTSMYTPEQLFRLAVDVAKKRSYYSPSTSKKKKGRKKRMGTVKTLAIRAATAAATAVVTAAAAAEKVSSAADTTTATAHDNASTEESEDDGALREFLALDAEAQSARKKSKVVLTTYKEGAAAAASATSAETTSSASVKPTKTRAKSSKRTKSKSTRRATKPKRTSKPAEVDCDLHIGTRVLGFWPKDDDSNQGEWFEGVVQSIDYVEQTVDILYNDNDRDDSVPWTNTRILDPISESDG